MNTNKQKDISITMSHALRHNPAQYGFEVDEYGFVDINLFLEGLRKHGGSKCRTVTLADVEEIVRNDPKGRYEIANGKIRAQGGHSGGVGKTIIKTVATPPDILYHGTTPDAAWIILHEGLKGMERQNANLSVDTETAIIVGKRRTKTPVILVADCKQAAIDGIEFYLESNGIYSVKFLPAKYISKVKGN